MIELTFTEVVIALAYLAAGILFILGLKGLTSPRTARRGNRMAAVGMLVAIIVTIVFLVAVEELSSTTAWAIIAAGIVVGGAIGAFLALRVQMVDMPQLVAAFNGFGGGASALVAAAVVVGHDAVLPTETGVTTALSLAIGAVTLTGSMIAFAKLQGLIGGKPVAIPGGPVTNGFIAGLMVIVAVFAVVTNSPAAYWGATALALVLGMTAVLPIGGADMPVVISLLNSFSGLAAAMAGFTIGNQALIIGGALVGAAGMILTLDMSVAMNRSIPNILFSGFGGTVASDDEIGTKPVKRATAEDAAIALSYAQNVMVVPGYGLAVAQAQHAVKELATVLEARGVNVNYAIHPVAGRMPGHMNVLLAEADVPYDHLLDLDQSNPKFGQTDVVLVIGANDVVNPSAHNDENSPIYGMPILDVEDAATVIVVKRSLSPGFAGIDNPLFYQDGTMMFFSDAKKALEDTTKAVNEL